LHFVQLFDNFHLLVLKAKPKFQEEMRQSSFYWLS